MKESPNDYSFQVVLMWPFEVDSVVVRSGAGCPGAVRSQFSPQPGRWGGAKPFCAPAGALGRGEATLRPGLGRWGGALMFFGPSGAPHAPGRCQRPGAHVPPQ